MYLQSPGQPFIADPPSWQVEALKAYHLPSVHPRPTLAFFCPKHQRLQLWGAITSVPYAGHARRTRFHSSADLIPAEYPSPPTRIFPYPLVTTLLMIVVLTAREKLGGVHCKGGMRGGRGERGNQEEWGSGRVNSG